MIALIGRMVGLALPRQEPAVLDVQNDLLRRAAAYEPTQPSYAADLRAAAAQAAAASGLSRAAASRSATWSPAVPPAGPARA